MRRHGMSGGGQQRGAQQQRGAAGLAGANPGSRLGSGLAGASPFIFVPGAANQRFNNFQGRV